MIVDSLLPWFNDQAEQRGMYSVGFHSTGVQNMRRRDGSAASASLGRLPYREIQAIEKGTWKSNPKICSATSTAIWSRWRRGGRSPYDVKTMVEAKITDFKTGKAQVFAAHQDNKGN